MKKIIVIGAGILGASTAYHLSKLGAEVTIIDRQDKGQATDAAAGIICPWLSQRRNQTWYRLAKAGARYYPSLIAELKQDGEGNTGYARVGALCIHHDYDKLIKMKERAEKRKEDAPEIGELTLLTELEAKERFPLLSEGYAALHVTGAARVDGRRLRDALLSSAQRHGTRLITGNAQLQQQNGVITAVKVNGEAFTADEFIVCAGAWSNQLLHPLGIMMHVRYQKAQIMHLQTEADVKTAEWPVVMPPTDQYLLAFDEGRIVIGATHENDVVGYDTNVTAGGMHEILTKGMDIASGLADCSLHEIRVGFRPFTAGFLPVLGKIDGWQKLIVANGLGSSGLTMGPYIGQQLAKLALDMELDIHLEDYAVAQAMITA